MSVELTKRAEAALRSLSPIGRKRALKALSILGDRGQTDLEGDDQHVSRIDSGRDKLFVYRASERLRLVFSRQEGHILVEDILNPDQLRRWTGRQR